MPRELLEELGVRPRREVRLRLADGRSHVQQLGSVQVELDGIEDITAVAFADPGYHSTTGTITLETLLLGVDPVIQRLVPVEGLQL